MSSSSPDDALEVPFDVVLRVLLKMQQLCPLKSIGSSAASKFVGSIIAIFLLSPLGLRGSRERQKVTQQQERAQPKRAATQDAASLTGLGCEHPAAAQAALLQTLTALSKLWRRTRAASNVLL
jgi:hypothetical protein